MFFLFRSFLRGELGMKKLFVESGVDFSRAIATQTKEVNTTLEEENNELVKENVALKSKLEKSTAYLLISEKTKGLTESMRRKVFESFKGEPSGKIEEKIDGFIGVLKESARTNRKRPVKGSETPET